jgi:glutamate synthase (NADPH/NADH)
VLLAMGFLGPEKYISSELDLTLDPRSNYQTPSGLYHTSVPKVFAAGGTVLFNVSLFCREVNEDARIIEEVINLEQRFLIISHILGK